MSTWLLVLAYFGELCSIVHFDGGYTVVHPGYYILLEKRGQDGVALGWKLQSDRFISETEALVAFEQEIK